MKKLLLPLTFLVYALLFFSCNNDLIESNPAKSTLLEIEDTSDNPIETIFNRELKYVNDKKNEYILINVGSNFEENLDYYLTAYEIKVNVDGSEYFLDENQNTVLKKASLKFLDNDNLLNPENNQFEIQFLSSSFALGERSISLQVIPGSTNNSQLLFPQSLTEITSPKNHRWGRVNRYFIFGNDELNIPNTNPGYFIAYPLRRSCGLCFWTTEWNQTKEFTNVGDELIFGNNSWSRVRFRIRHDAQNFSVRFKRNAADPW